MLSRESSEEEIRTIFESYGRVDEVVLIKDRETGQSKGFYPRSFLITTRFQARLS